MKHWRACLLWLVLPGLLMAQSGPKPKTPETIRKMHQDPKSYIAMLENPQRDSEQKPGQVISAMGIKQGEILVDIGAGSGYFSFRFARAVGNAGRVYAVDINPDMIRHMNRRIRDLKLRNVVTVLSDPDDPLIPAETVDRFFICNTWHHVENKPRYMALMKRMLRKGGQLIIIDYNKKELPVGPPPEMKIARREVVKQVESNGFRLAHDHRFLPYQYFLVFTPK